MIKPKFIKKLISLFLCTSFLVVHSTPILAETFYDFSDEAQEQFNINNNIQTTSEPIYTKTIEKNSKKDKNKTVESELIQQESLTEAIQNKTLEGSIVYIPKGENFQAVLQSSISSASTEKDDTIAAVLHEDWTYNGFLIAPMGSIVYGKTTDAKKAGAAYGNGKLAITFTEIVTPKGECIKLDANIVEIQVESKRAIKVAAKTIGGAAIGMAVSIVFALITDRDISNAALRGAGIGAAGGAFNAVLQKGEEAQIPAGTGINIRLIQPINVTPYQ